MKYLFRKKVLGPASQKKGIPLSSNGDPIQAAHYEEVRYSSRLHPKRKYHHEPLRLEKFSSQELKYFFAILLYAADKKVSSIRKLWNSDFDHGIHPFVTRLMSLGRFELMFSCFCFEDKLMAEIEELLRRKSQEIWIPSNFACCDESLVPYKGRKNNPHHVYIMRKPHPHGVKVSSNVFLCSNNSFFRFGP